MGEGEGGGGGEQVRIVCLSGRQGTIPMARVTYSPLIEKV
jgi:hypothetical protein